MTHGGDPPSVPRTLGRYEVVGHLATGGMAEIFLGRLAGPSGFERLVVIKKVLPHLARTKSFVDMFLDEARIVARIRHPNVVQVHELCREGDELFLVMEYIEGESIAGLLKRLWVRGERLDHVLSAHVIAEACAGLHVAHELEAPDGRPLRLVHRDISPQNVMITYGGQVKVLDFGIAQAADRLARTQTGHVKGKYEYMSPEQCLGKPLDRRSDIFSLGTLLYELSANRRLFKRSNELATMKAICEQRITPPSQAHGEYPASLEVTCLRALSRNPDHRHATALDLRRDLLSVIRQCGGADDEKLSLVMARLFADRIEESAAMIRCVRAGDRVPKLLDPDPEGQVDLGPAVEADPGGASSSDIGLARGARRARLWPVLVGLAGVGLATAAATLAWRSAPVAAGDAVVEPQPATPPPADTGAKETPLDVSVRIETSPAGARLFVDDREQGATPAQVAIPRGDAPVRLEARHEGFVTWSQVIVPAESQSFVVTLRPAPTPGPPRPRSARTTSTATAPAPSPSFWRLP